MSDKHPLRWLRNKFVRDAATLQAAGVLSQFSQMASTVLIAFLLGASGQGAYVSAIALQGLVYFLVNMGVRNATVSQLAAAHARDNRDKVAGWLAFLSKAILAFGFVIVPLGYFVIPWLGEVIFGIFSDAGADYGRRIGFWAWLLCFQPLLELPRTVAGVAFQGTRRMLALSQIEIAQELVRVFLVILGALVTGSPLGAIVGHLAACAVGSVLSIDIYRRALHDGQGYLPGVRDVMRGIPQVPLRRGLRLGLRVGILKNSHSLFINIFPRLIVGGVVGLDWVAYFHIAQRIMQVPLLVMFGVSRVVVPALGELAGLKDIERFKKLFFRVTLVTGGVVATGILLLMPFVEPVTRMLLPEDYAKPVAAFYRILAIGYVILPFGSTHEAFYVATNTLRAWFWISTLGTAILLPLNIYLIKTVPYTGTAWGLSAYLSWVLAHFFYIGYFFRKSRTRAVWEGQDMGGGDADPSDPAAAEQAS
ncbi:MAG: O-antigen/teichoic acid export membrane protein [Chlamydiales bacterium]|jgi:O-antigen/teichoic acid export membrane protein